MSCARFTFSMAMAWILSRFDPAGLASGASTTSRVHDSMVDGRVQHKSKPAAYWLTGAQKHTWIARQGGGRPAKLVVVRIGIPSVTSKT